MSAADERAKATGLAASDFPRALQAARQVSDPWYRCQALAAVARSAPEGEVVRVADEALAAACQGHDVYRRVAVCAWPIRALAARGQERRAQQRLRPLLEEAGRDPHPVSRMAALILLWQAAWPLPPAGKQPVLDALLAACRAADSWKAGRIMRDVALAMASEDRPQAQQIIRSMREGTYKRQAQRRLDVRQEETARFFFPQAARQGSPSVARLEKALLRKAARVRHMDTSQSVLQASLDAAQTVIADQSEFRLPPAQWEAFCRRLDEPARTIPALRRLFGEPEPYDA